VFLLWLGHAAEAAGEPAGAGPEYAEARELARANGDTFFEAVAARGQASVAIQQGNIAAARRLLREAVVVSRSLDDTTIAYGTLLAHFARLAAAEGHPERALRLAGAALALRQEAGTHLHAYDRELLERSLEPARRLITAEAAATAWSDGQAMGLEAALAYAETPGGEDPRAGTRVRRFPTMVSSDSAILTAREREIAGLAARGWTNRQIAAELVISSGTAKRHLENILAKLGLASRAQLPDWFAQHERGRGVNRPSMCS
jgi:non-specific serine/threonine protein kinase